MGLISLALRAKEKPRGGKFATSTPSKIPGVGNRTTTIKIMIL